MGDLMKVLTQTGDARRMVEFGDAPTPTPKTNEALIKIEAFSLNRVDLIYLSTPGSHWRTGIDFAGTVVSAAKDNSGPRQGDKVLVHLPTGGGAAEYAAVATDAMTTIPEGISLPEAAALPLARLVALRLVREAGSLRHQHVLVNGATGGG